MDKNLKIKLLVDTKEADKISASLDKQSAKSKELIALETQLKVLEAKRLSALEQVTSKFEKIKEVISKGSSTAIPVIQASADLAKVEKQVDALTTSYNRLQQARYKSLVIEAGQNNLLNNEIKLYENFIKEKESTAAKARLDIARNELAQHKQYYAERKAMYQDLLRYAPSTASSNPFLGNTTGNAGKGIGTSNTVEGVRARNPLTGELTKANVVTTEAIAKNKALNNVLDEQRPKYRSLATHILEAVSIYRIWVTTLNLARDALLNIPKAGILQQQNEAAITAIFGTVDGKEQLKFIDSLANKTGQVITNLEQSYAKFVPSAVLAGAKQKEVNQVFEDFTKVGTVLSLTQDKMGSIFYALEQIYAKGVAQSEEVKKQLGNVLPGALEIAAKAMGKTPAEFIKAMKANEVTAKEFVPKFASLYKEIFAGGNDEIFNSISDRFQFNLNRITTEYTKVNRAAYANLESTFNDVAKATAVGLATLNENLGGLKEVVTVLTGFFAIRFAPALGIAAVGALTASSRLSVLTRVLFGLSAPATAVVAGVGALVLALSNLRLGYDSTIGFTVKFGNETAKLSEIFIATYTKITAAYQAFYKTLTEINIFDIYSQASDAKNFKNFIANFNNNLQEGLAQIGSSGNIVTDAIAKTRLDSMKQFSNLTAKELDNLVKKGQLTFEQARSLIEERNKQPIIEGQVKPQENLTDIAVENEQKLSELKDLSFAKDEKIFNKKKQQLKELYDAEVARINLSEKQFKTSVDLRSGTNPVSQLEIINQEANFRQQRLAAEENYQKKLINLVDSTQEKINKSVNDGSTNLERALKVIQKIESAGKPGAVSPTGAVGLRQVQPSTLSAPDFGEKFKFFDSKEQEQELLKLEKIAKDKYLRGIGPGLSAAQRQVLRQFALTHVEELAEFGINYYKALVKKNNGDLTKAAIAYNAGQGKANLPFNRLPKETQGYVTRFRELLGGSNLEANDIDKTTEKQAALDSLKQINNEKLIEQENKKAEIARLTLEIKKAEQQLGIELLDATDRTKEAELAKIKAEFAERYVEAERLGSEFLKRRLPVLEQAKIKQVELKFLQEKYNDNERIFNQQVQEYTNKSLVGRLKNYQAAGAIAELQRQYLVTQTEILNKELALTNTQEQRVEIENKLALLKQKQVETASFNYSFTRGEAGNAVEQAYGNDVSIEASLQAGLELNREAYSQGLIDYQEYQTAKAEIEDQAIQASIANNASLYGALAGLAANNFADITNFTIKMYGEQSAAAKASFVAQKAFSAGEALMSGIKATQDAYAAGMSVGGPAAPVTAAAFAAIAGVATAARVATILSQPVPSGAAHGGLENVPKESTYLLDKGERVLSPRQNVKLTSQVDAIYNNNTGQSSPNIRIVNVMDENLVYNALGSDQAEKLVMNIVNKNR